MKSNRIVIPPLSLEYADVLVNGACAPAPEAIRGLAPSVQTHSQELFKEVIFVESDGRKRRCWVCVYLECVRLGVEREAASSGSQSLARRDVKQECRRETAPAWRQQACNLTGVCQHIRRAEVGEDRNQTNEVKRCVRER